jgi:hypothetical protein
MSGIFIMKSDDAATEELQALYLAAINAHLAKHPRLEWTREHEERWTANARVGRMTRQVEPKGRSIPRDTLVLFTVKEHKGSAKVWYPENPLGTMLTSVRIADVREGAKPLCQDAPSEPSEPPHVCDEHAVYIETDGPLGHGWECGICGEFLQAG